ncbi:MAG: type II toxin-antitoxin system RelE/ParE family toxin [Thermodesulfobacteriota bacterium]|jgi:phage-related protein|nr:type II toxin-antitoxin system RelE/ParE family toxin [Thermodesulfobacteriota bacterium]
MNWRVIFYRSASGKCPIEKFIEDLPVEDAEEVVASIAVLKELGNKARRPLSDYLEDGIYELRARRFKKQFRVLYAFAGRQTILLLTGFVKKSKAVPNQKMKKAKALRKDYFVRVKGGEDG